MSFNQYNNDSSIWIDLLLAINNVILMIVQKRRSDLKIVACGSTKTRNKTD